MYRATDSDLKKLEDFANDSHDLTQEIDEILAQALAELRMYRAGMPKDYYGNRISHSVIWEIAFRALFNVSNLVTQGDLLAAFNNVKDAPVGKEYEAALMLAAWAMRHAWEESLLHKNANT